MELRTSQLVCTREELAVPPCGGPEGVRSSQEENFTVARHTRPPVYCDGTTVRR
jgi:hypothetical protein